MERAREQSTWKKRFQQWASHYAPGGAPRDTTFSSKMASSPRRFFSSGSVTVRHVSTLGSIPSFVMPFREMDSGCRGTQRAHRE